MQWQAPSYVEIRMDAEISAYQDEGDPMRNFPVVEAQAEADAARETQPAEG